MMCEYRYLIAGYEEAMFKKLEEYLDNAEDEMKFPLNLNVKEIDVILADLLKKGFLEYVSQGKKTVTTLNPLKKKLYK
mgnify:CR=1 FL=1